MSRATAVEVGTRGIRGINPSIMDKIEDSPMAAQLMNQALNGEGELFFNSKEPNDWIVVKNIAALTNNNGETMRDPIRVEIKFDNGLYLLRNDDPDKESKLNKLKSLPQYGTRIRPMAEISRENKAKAQAEAIKTLATIDDKEGIRTIIQELAPKLEQLGVTSDVVAKTLNSLNSPKATVAPPK